MLLKQTKILQCSSLFLVSTSIAIARSQPNYPSKNLSITRNMLPTNSFKRQ